MKGQNRKERISYHWNTNTTPSRKAHCRRYQTLFLGNYYFCKKFGHKALNCKENMKDSIKKDNFLSTDNYRKSDMEMSSKTLK